MALATNNRNSSVLKNKQIVKVQTTEAISFAFIYRR